MSDKPEGPEDGLAPLLDMVLEHVPRAEGRGGPVPHAGHHHRAQPVPRPHPHRPHLLGHRSRPTMPIHSLGRDGKEVEKGRVSKVLAFRGLERTPVDVAEAGDIVAIAGLPRPRPSPTRWPRRRSTEPLPRPADRSADPVDDLPHQRRPAGRPRRRQGAEPRHPRAPAARSRRQCRDQGHRRRRQRFVRSRRPRRTAARPC